MASPTVVYETLSTAYSTESGRPLAQVLSPNNVTFASFAFSSNPDSIARDVRAELLPVRHRHKLSEAELKSWIDVYVHHFRVAYALERSNGGRGDFVAAYDAQKDLTQSVTRGFQNTGWQNWMLSVLYETCKTLYILAIKADIVLLSQNPQKPEKDEKLEDAARVINKGFMICISDRAQAPEESKKWGAYYMATLLFKTYFKLNQVGLCKSVLNAIKASLSDFPSLEAFPKYQRCSYNYWTGIYYFLQGDYTTAETNLTEAFNECYIESKHNQELILTYLIPTRLAHHQLLPSQNFLSKYPTLNKLFTPIFSAIRRGSLRDFDAALLAAEDTFVSKRIFLTLEKGREICLRNALRKTWLCLDEDKRQKVLVETFRVGLGISSGVGAEGIDGEEVECLLTNMIAGGLMKGYISHERQTVVLSAKDPFPGTGLIFA